MYNFYRNNYLEEKIKKHLRILNNIYFSVPETTGCLENINKENGCGGFCCSIQNPSLFFIEFLNVWKHVKKQDKSFVDRILINSVKNHLSSKYEKSCVFWDKETKLCTIHNNRPFNCMIYSQTPEEDFNPRYERLKVLYPDKDIRKQCNLTKTEGLKPSKEEIDGWFKQIRNIEKVFVEDNLINDKDGGSYRAFHDHVILKFGKDKLFKTLSSNKDIDVIVKEIESDINEYFIQQ